MPWKISARNWNAAVVLAMTFLPLSILQAQDAQQDTRPPVVSVDRIPQDSHDANPQPASPPAAAHPLGQPADGRRRGDLPLEAYAVVPGTRLLVGLENALDTGVTKQGMQFRAKTLEPMEAGSGI